MSIKIVTDSASDMGLAKANELGITYLPLSVYFGDDVYKDGIDLSPEKFYDMLEKSNELPKTSQVTPYQFEEAFRSLVEQGHEVIAITISSELSGTNSSANIAAAEFPGKVFVVDSRTASLGEKLLIEYAYELIEKGMAINDIVAELEIKKDKLKIFFLMDTLEYLYKGGRLSKVEAIAGAILSVKPIVTVNDGKVAMAGKARGFKKGSIAHAELLVAAGTVDQSMPYGFSYSGTDDCTLNQFKTNYAHLFNKDVNDIDVTVLGSTVGTHIGPGSIGVAYFAE